MKELIDQMTSSLGMSESSARSATGGLLNFVKERADAADFTELMDRLPGAAEILGEAGGTGASSGGGLGGLMGKASSALGGGLGSGLGVLGQLKDSGLGADQLGSFVKMFVGYVKEKAGDDLVGRVLAKIPEVGSLLG